MAETERVSVTEASRRGVARLVADAAHGTEVVVERHGEPVAAVVAYDRYTELVAARAPTCATWRSCSVAAPTTTGRATRSTTWSTPSAAPGAAAAWARSR